jgi:hypothetical protein
MTAGTQVCIFMPEFLNRLTSNLFQNIYKVVITIGTGKNEHPKFHGTKVVLFNFLKALSLYRC